MHRVYDLNQNPLRTLLYVEDNSANALLVEEMIDEHCNLKLLTATNGNQGIQMASSLQPDLILMDIELPDINGLEVLKTLREDPATANIPVVAVSAHAYQKQIEEGLKAGFFRYLTKPYKLNELINAIDAGLNDVPENFFFKLTA